MDAQYSDVPSGYKVLPSAVPPPSYSDVPEGYKVLGSPTLPTPQSPSAVQTPPAPAAASAAAGPTINPPVPAGLQGPPDPTLTDDLLKPRGSGAYGVVSPGPTTELPASGPAGLPSGLEFSKEGLQEQRKGAAAASGIPEIVSGVQKLGSTGAEFNPLGPEGGATKPATVPQARQAMQGAAELVSGGMKASAPFTVPAIAAAPVRTALNLLLATGVSKAAHELAKRAGLSPEAQELAGVLPYFIPYEEAIRLGIDPKIAVASSAEGTAVHAGIRGAKGGVAVTPDEIILKGGVLGKEGEIRIPRNKPTASALEAPTIEGQAKYSDVPEGYKVVPPEQKPVVHASNDVEDLRASAERQAPNVGDAVAAATKGVPDAKVEAIRDSKDTDRIEDKATRQGVQPSQITDISGAKVTVPDQEAAKQVLANLHESNPVQKAEGSVTGEPQKNGIRQVQALVDTKAPAGEPVKKAEVILQTPEMHAASEQTHDDYRKAQELRAAGKDAEAEKLEAKIIDQHNAAEHAARERLDTSGQGVEHALQIDRPKELHGSTQEENGGQRREHERMGERQQGQEATAQSAEASQEKGRPAGSSARTVSGIADVENLKNKPVEVRDSAGEWKPGTVLADATTSGWSEGKTIRRLRGVYADGSKFDNVDISNVRKPSNGNKSYGVDFDGTLFKEKPDGSIGAPIPERIASLKQRIASGEKVIIESHRAQGRPEEVTKIQDALESVGLPRLEVTGKKNVAPELVDDTKRTVAGVQVDKVATDANTPLPPERRINPTERKRVTEMSPEEMKKELLTSPVTQMPNRRAFDEAAPSNVVGMSDADGLKAFNDKFGYDAGNELLRAKADALKEAGLDAYHEKGDEFLYRGKSEPELKAQLEKARAILKSKEFRVTDANGRTVTLKGVDFSHGTGPDIATAEKRLKAHKSEREASGERARGELRGITEVGPKAAPEGPADKVEPKFKHGSTQATIIGPAAKALTTLRDRIADSDLAGKGKDVGGNHVTVRYGIKGDESIESIEKYLASLSPFTATLGKTEKFPPSEHSEGAAVIIAPIESPELHKINAEIEKRGDFAESSFPEYQPHATVAYVSPEKAGRYVGMTAGEGKTFKINSIDITDRQGNQRNVVLQGKSESQVKVRPAGAAPIPPKREASDIESIKARIAQLETKAEQHPPRPPIREGATGGKVANGLRAVADRMDVQIENARRPMNENPTPKRMAQYRTRVIEAGDVERTQKAMRALADAHEAGTISRDLATLRSKDEIGRLVHKGLDSSKGGYYDRIPRNDYYDKSVAGKKLQDLIEGVKSPEATAAKAAKEKSDKIAQLEAEVQFRPMPGYFPTPKPVVEKMLDAADIKPGMSVLEPSAGKGNIADAIKQKIPDAKLSVAEQQPKLQEILKLKDHNFVDSDFLQHDAHYDRIVMNPPFEKSADVEHVRHAYDLLKPGGRLVAIMSPHAEFASDKKSADFRQWLDSLGGESEKLPEGSFKESGTGVNSRMITIDKPSSNGHVATNPQVVETPEVPRTGPTFFADLKSKIDSLTNEMDAALEAGDTAKANRLRNEMKGVESELVKAQKAPEIPEWQARNQRETERILRTEQQKSDEAKDTPDIPVKTMEKVERQPEPTKAEKTFISDVKKRAADLREKIKVLKEDTSAPAAYFQDSAKNASYRQERSRKISQLAEYESDLKDIEKEHKYDLATKVTPDVVVPESGRNFEGRYLKAAIEPAREAWQEMMSPEMYSKAARGKPIGNITPPKGEETLLVKIPDDGTFLIPNTPQGLEHAVKAADKFPMEKEPESAARRVPESPKEFDTEKYITGIEKEVADLTDQIRKAGDMQKSYLEEQLKAANENLAAAKKVTPGSLLADESGSFTPAALNPAHIRSVYDKAVDEFISGKLKIGDKYHDLAKQDAVIANDLHLVDNAPRYFAKKAESNLAKVTKGLSEDQIRLASMMVDSDSRDYLRKSKPDEYRQAMQDPKVEAAVSNFQPLQEELTKDRQSLGWPVRMSMSVEENKDAGLDENLWIVKDREGTPVADFKSEAKAERYVADKAEVEPHLKRTYPEHSRSPLPADTGAGPVVGSYPHDKGLRPPRMDKKAREMSAEYHYEHGRKDFSGYIDSFKQTKQAILKQKLFDDFSGKATKWTAGTAQPPQIEYNDKKYYRPDIVAKAKQAPSRRDREDLPAYGIYDPTRGEKFMVVNSKEGWGSLMTGKSGITATDRFLGPKEVVDAMENYDTSRGGESGKLRKFFQEQIVGLFGPMVHINNIVRRIGQATGTGAFDPRSWPSIVKVITSPTLRERVMKGVDDATIDMLSKYGAYTDWNDIGNLNRYIGGNLNPLSWIRAFGKGVLFDPKFAKGWGGLDPKARVVVADYFKDHFPKMTEAEVAKAVEDGFGNYARSNWTERQRLLAKFTLFPGWDAASVKWFLRHPFRVGVAGALVVLAINQALKALGKNKGDDGTDLSYIHIGDRKFKSGLVSDSMGDHLMSPVLGALQAKLRKEDIGAGAVEGGMKGSSALAGTLAGPVVEMVADEIYNRKYAGGASQLVEPEDKYTPGTWAPNVELEKRIAFAALKGAPALNRFINQSGHWDWEQGLGGAVLGLTNFKYGAEERLRANLSKAYVYAQTMDQLSERNPEAAAKFVSDPQKATYLMFHDDLSQMGRDLKDIDTQIERVRNSDMPADDRRSALESLKDNRNELLKAADGLNDALSDAKTKQ